MSKFLLVGFMSAALNLYATEIGCEVKRVNAKYKNLFVHLKQEKIFNAKHLKVSEHDAARTKKIILSSSDLKTHSVIEESPGRSEISLEPTLRGNIMINLTLKPKSQSWPVHYRLTFSESLSTSLISSTLWVDPYEHDKRNNDPKKNRFVRLAVLMCSIDS